MYRNLFRNSYLDHMKNFHQSKTIRLYLLKFRNVVKTPSTQNFSKTYMLFVWNSPDIFQKLTYSCGKTKHSLLNLKPVKKFKKLEYLLPVCRNVNILNQFNKGGKWLESTLFMRDPTKCFACTWGLCLSHILLKYRSSLN